MLCASFAVLKSFICQVRRCRDSLPIAGLLLVAAVSTVQAAKPVFDGSSLTLPKVQVGEDILSVSLDLINPADLTFQIDFQNIGQVATLAQAACIDPYFSFTQSQLVVPVLEVGDARYQVILDLIDAQQGLFRVSPASPLLIESADTDAPAFSVWQTGDSIAIEWGAPSDNVDGYKVWYTPYQSGAPMEFENLGSLTELAVVLPVGVDFCLSVSSYGPEGDSDLSEFERFVNVEVPYTTYETDDSTLTSLFLPTLHDSLGMALMYDATEEDTPYGAVFDSQTDDVSLVLAFNPDTGLLTRITYGEVIYHFMNYTATTVDVVESVLDGEIRVYPNLPLSNHAISVIEALIEAFESPGPNPLIIPAEPDPGFLQSADWAKQGLEIGLDILRKAGFESESMGETLLTQLGSYVDGFRGDIFKSQTGDDSEQELEDAQQLVDTLINQFDCAGEPGYSCAAYALNQADFDAFRLNLPETIADQIQNLIDAVTDASDKQMLLNQDCQAIEDELERLACLDIQGNPEPGEQEDPLPINESQDDAVAQELEALQQQYAQATQSINSAELQSMMLVGELNFEYQQLIGQRIWVTGYYGDDSNNEYGYGYLLNDPILLDIDEQLPHHSHAMLDGDLPPQNWNRAEVLIYGEIKDFATASGLYSIEPVPLITVIDTVQISPPLAIGEPGSSVLLDGPQFMHTPGTQASACDRVVIIAGGVDARGNHPRYRQALSAIHTKAKGLGFSDAQIEVFYFDGSEIDAGDGNIVDEAADKQKILDHLAALKEEMDPSCTLTVFVSDHGTGFSSEKGFYRGERPVFSGTEYNEGTTYPEDTFMFNAKIKTYERTAWTLYRGVRYRISRDAEGTIELYKMVDGSISLVGEDVNNDGRITEAETDTDFNGDGDKTEFGWDVSDLEDRVGPRVYYDNIWDYDRDGVDDVRLRWDGTRYVAERRVGEEWHEMGRDTNGDYMIDETDGGVDWNLDGDKNDHVGFHEGINLLGREVLWDDELADALKMLYDTGIHNNVFMVSCYSGGFVLNLQDYVENIFVGSKEDLPHWSKDGGTGEKIHDTNGFLNNWHGIDRESWLHGEQGARDADSAVGDMNMYFRGGVKKYESNTLFEEIEDGEYLVKLDLPFELLDGTYDFEFIFGLQIPRWDASDFEILGGLDEYTLEPIPGGFRVFDIIGIFDGEEFRIRAPDGLDMMRIELTDINHNRLGFIMAMPGVVQVPLEKFESDSAFESYGAIHKIKLDIPDELVGSVFDFELYYEDQDPPWLPPVLPMPGILPPEIQFEFIDGGIRFYSEFPIPDNQLLEIFTQFNTGSSMLQIELTDNDHEALGFVMAMPGTIPLLPPPLLINPCVPGDLWLEYNNGGLPPLTLPDPIFFGCNGQASLGAPFPNGNGGPFNGTWFLDGPFMEASFGFGATNFLVPLPPFPPLLPGQPSLPLPTPPDICLEGVQHDHFGQPGNNAFICPGTSSEILSLGGDRFQVEIEWEDFPEGGPAQGFQLANDTGAFWFFDPQHAEMLVKVLDGCSINNHFWVFAAATTNVEFTMTVTDTQTSQQSIFTNPLGTPAQAITDTQAFATCP